MPSHFNFTKKQAQANHPTHLITKASLSELKPILKKAKAKTLVRQGILKTLAKSQLIYKRKMSRKQKSLVI